MIGRLGIELVLGDDVFGVGMQPALEIQQTLVGDGIQRVGHGQLLVGLPRLYRRRDGPCHEFL